ncbi:MAG TPA: ArsR family transcriptional regulator [Longimicrobiaceae bacterium]|nr:ArsR family transcriptional regulator [Longimicrobiaceae bacterium]
MKRKNRGEAGAGGTRDRVLARLRRSRCTVNDLAAEVGLTDNAVRAHLGALEAEGLAARVEVLRKGVGKPAHVYALTPAGEELFARAYAPVLGVLLEVLAERLGPEGEAVLLREAGRRAAGGEASGDVRARAEAAVEVLGALGGDAEVVAGEGGKWWIRSSGCPLSSVVRGHPAACQLAEALVERLVGVEVRECCERGDRPRCRFEIG